MIEGIASLIGSIVGVAAPMLTDKVNPLDQYKVQLEAARLKAEQERRNQELVKTGAMILGAGVAAFFVYKIATKPKKRRRR